MLKSVIDDHELRLLAQSRIPAHSGHGVHKGTPREAFIQDFLASHLSEKVSTGTGEILDANSKSGEDRPQIDIVIHNHAYPRLDFGGAIVGFLAESVVATIEVKSTLNKEDIEQSVKTASTVKKLDKSIVVSFSTGYHPPSILSFVVAYNGPAKMKTVHKWINEVHADEGISYPPMGNTGVQRLKAVAPSLDAVFVLGKGSVHFDNSPLTFITDEQRSHDPDGKWLIINCPSGNLFLLFLFLTLAVSGMAASWLDPMPYLKNYSIPDEDLTYAA